MRLARCWESLNQPKLLVPVPAPAARIRWASAGKAGGSAGQGCALLWLLGSVFFLPVLHELHRDSYLVGRADGCRLPFSSASSLLWSPTASPEADPQLGAAAQLGLLQPGFGSLGLDSLAAAGPPLPGHFSRCMSTGIAFLLEGAIHRTPALCLRRWIWLELSLTPSSASSHPLVPDGEMLALRVSAGHRSTRGVLGAALVRSDVLLLCGLR